MRELIETYGVDPVVLAEKTGKRLSNVARRLGSLPEDMAGPVGLFICDATGRMIVQKPALGIDPLRMNSSWRRDGIFEWDSF